MKNPGAYTREEKEIKELFKDIVKGYKKGIPSTNVEIMLYCDEYLGVS